MTTTTFKFRHLKDGLDFEPESMSTNILGNLVESGCQIIEPEHLLAAMIQIPDSMPNRRIIRQNLRPENLSLVLQQSVERSLDDVISVMQIDDVEFSEPLGGSLGAYLAENKNIKEAALFQIIINALPEQTKEDLREFAALDFERFALLASQANELLQVWNNNDEKLKVSTHFDKAARMALDAMKAEAQGLGLSAYSPESLFIALLNIVPSVMDMALCTLINKGSYFTSSEDLVKEFRSRLCHPYKLGLAAEITRSDCDATLNEVFKEAATIAANEGKEKISVRDLAEALLRKQKNGRLHQLLKMYQVDYDGLCRFINTYQEENHIESEKDLPLETLASQIKERIVGQDHAVQRILPFIKRLRFGYRRPGKPAGVFLFMGQSGTGKTEMAKVLAKILYGSEESLIMLEMGQFGTKESKSMFIGASPGYVGYGDGKLTNGLRDKPECVVLFDEVEKADPLVLDVLLRFLDEGKIDDPAGPIRDGSKCLIVLTSNFFADRLNSLQNELEGLASKDDEEKFYAKLRKELLQVSQDGDVGVKKFFRPEFIFRIDEIILFRSFSLEDFRQIAEIQLKREFKYILDNHDYQIICQEEDLEKILTHIGTRCMNRTKEGARVINRLVNEYVVVPIIDFWVAHPGDRASKLVVSFEDGQVTVRGSDG